MNKHAVFLVLLGIGLSFITACSQQKPPPSPPPNSPQSTNQQLPQELLASDPIVAIGHGVMVGADGQRIVPTAQLIESIQRFYIQRLLDDNKSKDEKDRLSDAAIEAARKAISGEVADTILANALLIDWLVEKVQPPDLAQVTNVTGALRWHYVLKIQKDPVLPEENQWGKGLTLEAAKRVEEKTGMKVWAFTNAAGEAYCQECLDAGVPVPNFMFGAEWRFLGEVENEFLETGRTELWIHESQSPPGVCLALPRFTQEGNEAQVFGVICLGAETSKACFFDNPQGRLFQRDVVLDFKKEFVGGADLVANDQGICTDCHAGENPYIVHPEKPPFAGILSQLRPSAWHDPLVVPSWPHNPGPSNQLDAVPSPGRCDSCHRAGGFAGRFPEISNQLSGYCRTVLDNAVNVSSKRTMPMPVASANRNQFIAHIDNLQASCGLPPTGGGVIVDYSEPDDPGVLSAPLVINPLYQCATTVGVRGAVLDAKVVLFVNGASQGTVSPARSPHLVEFTGLAALVAGDRVTASQEKDGVVATSAEVIVRGHRADFPAGLPAPTVDPVLIHECAEIIAVRHVPGATVTAFSNAGSPVSFTGGSQGWTAVFPGKRPFTVGDDFTAEISLCGDTSPRSVPGAAVAVAAPSSLPAARLNPESVFAGQQLVTLENLTHGTQTKIAEVSRGSLGNFSTPISWWPDFDVATPLGRPLSAGEKLRATQTLCAVIAVAEFPPARVCDDLPAPRIQHPTVGANYVVVAESIPGARIRVYDGADKEIGDGSGTVIVLTRTITGTDTLTVVQQVGDCSSKTGYRVSVRNPKPKDNK